MDENVSPEMNADSMREHIVDIKGSLRIPGILENTLFFIKIVVYFSK